MQKLRIEHFGISVTDMGRATRWYRDIFGFETIKEFEKPDLQIKGALMQKDGFSLEIIEPMTPEPNTAAGTSPADWLRRCGANHFSVSVEDVRSFYDELSSGKVDCISGLIDQRLFFCKDPDGTLIEVKQR